MDSIHQRTMDTILLKGVDRLSYLDAFITGLVEKVCKDFVAVQYLAEPIDRMIGSKIKDLVK